jgi:hypothetical protein
MSAYLLSMSLQVRCLAYFSTTFGWINALQVVTFSEGNARTSAGAAAKLFLFLECVGLVLAAVWRLGLWGCSNAGSGHCHHRWSLFVPPQPRTVRWVRCRKLTFVTFLRSSAPFSWFWSENIAGLSSPANFRTMTDQFFFLFVDARTLEKKKKQAFSYP